MLGQEIPDSALIVEKEIFSDAPLPSEFCFAQSTGAPFPEDARPLLRPVGRPLNCSVLVVLLSAAIQSRCNILQFGDAMWYFNYSTNTLSYHWLP